MSERRIIKNIKHEARISLTINRFWDEIHYNIRDKKDIIKAISELLDEKEKPSTKIDKEWRF